MNERYNEWLNSKYIDNEDKEILRKMSEKEIKESFNSDLSFGTSGIRGIMGLGSNKINKYTIGKVTVGFANYINKNSKDASVVIAYDTRNNSDIFALDVALILNYYGIKTYLFKTYTSTPELAYSVKYLKCNYGIVITSSHNPKEYNGYKIYNSFGSAITHPEDDLIIKEINSIKDLGLIKKAHKNNELFNYVSDEENKAFINENEKVIINKKLFEEYSSKIKVTYTSFHGVGISVAKKILDKYNFNYNVVDEQCIYDGNFITVPQPNPEYDFNYDLAIKYAKENNSDIIIATDPDADRLGVVIKNNDRYEYINGNIVGCLFLYYILNNTKISKNSYAIRSIVTSDFFDKIAKRYNVDVFEVLTGCKNIASKKLELDKKGFNYVFGFEESIGYMFNIDILDKCGFSSMIMILEILCYCKSINITIGEYIENIYKLFGYSITETLNFVYNDLSEINKYMDDFRTGIIDFKNKDYKRKDYLNEVGQLNTNALKYTYSDNSWIIIRPSGTEPKIKVYIGVTNDNINIAKEKINSLIQEVNDIFKN